MTLWKHMNRPVKGAPALLMVIGTVLILFISPFLGVPALVIGIAMHLTMGVES